MAHLAWIGEHGSLVNDGMICIGRWHSMCIGSCGKMLP